MSARLRPDGVTRQAVLDHLVHEADLDGIAIVSFRDVGTHLGISVPTAQQHIANLIAEGSLTHTGIEHRVNVYQLAESVIA